MNEKLDELQQKNDKVCKLLKANANVESIFRALCNLLLDEEYKFEIENEELKKILEEKPKKIEKIKIPESWDDPKKLTFEELKRAYKHNFEIIFRNANEIIDAVNYLLEKSERFRKSWAVAKVEE